MLLYHNRKTLRVLLQLTGSVFQNVLVTAVSLIIYASLLVFLLRAGYLSWLLDFGSTMRNAYAPQSFGVLSAFVVCFRTNIAWSRYWEACSQTTLMFVKWADAYTQINGFCNATLAHIPQEDIKRRRDIHHWRCVLAHWFSMLGGCATDRLINGDISMVESRDGYSPWGERVIHREALRSLMHASRGNVANMPRFVAFDLAYSAQTRTECGKDWRTRWWSVKKADDLTIPVLIELSDIEKENLQQANDRGLRVFGWIIEGTTSLHRCLDTPPPIFSRVYQELGAGNLGFHHAKKLADVPFPFIFTQLLAYMLFGACLLVPVFASMLSFQLEDEVSYITVLLSVMVCIPLVGLNEVSKELENPFGLDANDVPLSEGLECYIECLVDAFYSEIPKDHTPLTAEQERISAMFQASDFDGLKPESSVDMDMLRLSEHLVQSMNLTRPVMKRHSSEMTRDLRDSIVSQDRNTVASPDRDAMKRTSEGPTSQLTPKSGKKIVFIADSTDEPRVTKVQMNSSTTTEHELKQEKHEISARQTISAEKYDKSKRLVKEKKLHPSNIAFSYRPTAVRISTGRKTGARRSTSVPAERKTRFSDISQPEDDTHWNWNNQWESSPEKDEKKTG